MKDALKTQVGGDHYKKLAYQPAVFIHDMKFRFNSGAIVKYISRDKNDKVEDLRKAIHYCDICAELNETTIHTYINRFCPLRLEDKVWEYVHQNGFDLPGIVTEAIKAVATGNWERAKFNLGVLIDHYVSVKKKGGC